MFVYSSNVVRKTILTLWAHGKFPHPLPLKDLLKFGKYHVTHSRCYILRWTSLEIARHRKLERPLSQGCHSGLGSLGGFRTWGTNNPRDIFSACLQNSSPWQLYLFKTVPKVSKMPHPQVTDYPWAVWGGIKAGGVGKFEFGKSGLRNGGTGKFSVPCQVLHEAERSCTQRMLALKCRNLGSEGKETLLGQRPCPPAFPSGSQPC